MCDFNKVAMTMTKNIFEFLRSWQRKHEKHQDPKLHETDKQRIKRKPKEQKEQNVIII